MTEEMAERLRLNLLFQFATENLGHFETKGWNFLVFF
jgi:hypothetical protein